MKTLSEELTKLYNEHWGEFMAQLEANRLRDQLQCPFLISLLRSGQKKEEREKAQENDNDWYAKKETPENEEWYTKADIKIMFFGQETNQWVRDDETERKDEEDLKAEYEHFHEDHYNAIDVYFYHEGLKSGNRFLRWGINGIMDGMKEMLKDYPGKRVSMIWNELSKLSARTKNGGGPVDSTTHQIEKELFHVIPKEIEILKPDILIFLTGPGENQYYQYILENFTVVKQIPLGDLPVHDVSKLPIEGVKLAYKTYHPGMRNTSEAFHWTHYNAILADIKENIDKLLKKE